MIDEAVTAVVATVTEPGVPDKAADTPMEASAPVAICSLLPGVPSTKLPSVAVIGPRVAVRVVEATSGPVTLTTPAPFGIKLSEMSASEPVAVIELAVYVTPRVAEDVTNVPEETDVKPESEAGRERVIVEPRLATATCPAVPTIFIFPAVGERLLIVFTSEEPPPKPVHVAAPAKTDRKSVV